MKRYALGALFVVLFASCRSAARSHRPLRGSGSAPATSPAAAMLPDSIRWVGAAEYRGRFRAGLSQRHEPRGIRGAEARTGIVGSHPRRRRNSDQQRDLPEQSGHGQGFPIPKRAGAPGWATRGHPAAWRRRLPARVHALGGRIAIVTNRLQSVCEDTEARLRQVCTCVRRDAVPRGRHHLGQESAIRGGGRRENSCGFVAADCRRVRRRQHPRLSCS